jgi:hypothetical protein
MSAIALVGEANARGMLVNVVIDQETGDSMEYRHLIKHPKYKEVWTKSYANELGRLTNGIRDIPGTNTMTYIKKSDIPKDRLKCCTRKSDCRIVCCVRERRSEKWGCVHNLAHTRPVELVGLPTHPFKYLAAAEVCVHGG